MFGKPKTPRSRIDSLIGASTEVSGDLCFAGGLRIDGVIRGDVRAAGDAPSVVVVSEKARVEGSICATHVVINGTVLGPVSADDSLELQASARVEGDISYSTLEIQQGAVVQGRLFHAGSTGRPVELKLAS